MCEEMLNSIPISGNEGKKGGKKMKLLKRKVEGVAN